MKPAVVGIFAHPDDECFGPGGTLALLAKTHEVQLIIVTRGEGGELSHHETPNDLGRNRQHETEASAEILGVKRAVFLNFKDGFLCNDSYHAVSAEVENVLRQLKPEQVITFEPRGFSGHVDHMVVSSVTTHLYEKLPFIKKLSYFCITEKQRKAIPTYFVHFPPGYRDEQIDEVVDVSSVWKEKLQAILCHMSQKHDISFYEPMLKASGKKEHFIVLKKK